MCLVVMAIRGTATPPTLSQPRPLAAFCRCAGTPAVSTASALLMMRLLLGFGEPRCVFLGGDYPWRVLTVLFPVSIQGTGIRRLVQERNVLSRHDEIVKLLRVGNGEVCTQGARERTHTLDSERLLLVVCQPTHEFSIQELQHGLVGLCLFLERCLFSVELLFRRPIVRH